MDIKGDVFTKASLQLLFDTGGIVLMPSPSEDLKNYNVVSFEKKYNAFGPAEIEATFEKKPKPLEVCFDPLIFILESHFSFTYTGGGGPFETGGGWLERGDEGTEGRHKEVERERNQEQHITIDALRELAHQQTSILSSWELVSCALQGMSHYQIRLIVQSD